MKESILLVDDEINFLRSLELLLVTEGYSDVAIEDNPESALKQIAARDFDVVFLDVNMPGSSGMDLIKQILEIRPETACIMVTADERAPTIVEAMRLGAYDYLIKPITPNRLLLALTRALERRRLLRSLDVRATPRARKDLQHPGAFENIIGDNPKLVKLLHETELHAGSDITVLLSGETGVGKDLLARAIHQASPRSKQPFVAVNMLAISPTLFESEFFGHRKGSFTGATFDRKGYLADAEGGTLFLDEIGDLSLDIQGKLLRLLQERDYRPVGESISRKANVRFIAATNQDLPQAVSQGTFRKDLYYRLQFAHLIIPPLRERRDDLPVLCLSMLPLSSERSITITTSALDALDTYAFPGNVRELKGLIESAINLSRDGKITLKELRLPESSKRHRFNSNSKPAAEESDVSLPLAEVEKRHILAVYEHHNRNKTRTAKALEIGLRTLHRKLEQYDKH